MSETEVRSVSGNKKLEKIILKNIPDGKVYDLCTSAVFIFIGAAPRTELLKGIIETDDKGYILTGPDLPRNNGIIKGWNLDRLKSQKEWTEVNVQKGNKYRVLDQVLLYLPFKFLIHLKSVSAILSLDFRNE